MDKHFSDTIGYTDIPLKPGPPKAAWMDEDSENSNLANSQKINNSNICSKHKSKTPICEDDDSVSIEKCTLSVLSDENVDNNCSNDHEPPGYLESFMDSSSLITCPTEKNEPSKSQSSPTQTEIGSNNISKCLNEGSDNTSSSIVKTSDSCNDISSASNSKTESLPKMISTNHNNDEESNNGEIVCINLQNSESSRSASINAPLPEPPPVSSNRVQNKVDLVAIEDIIGK